MTKPRGGLRSLSSMKTVLLPVKDFANAKQRLAPALDPETRAGLARAMLTDVLSVIARARAPQRVVVFTASDEVTQMARPFGFDVVLENLVDGHSAAVNQMLEELSGTYTRILSIAGDLPRLVSVGNRFRAGCRHRAGHPDSIA